MTKAQEKRCDEYCKKMKMVKWKVSIFKPTMELYLSLKLNKKEQAEFNSEHHEESLELMEWIKTGKKLKSK